MVDPTWIRPVVEHCASVHATCAPEGLTTNQEELIKGAIEDVLSDMYGTSGDIWGDTPDVEQLMKRFNRLCKSGSGPEVRVLHSWPPFFARRFSSAHHPPFASACYHYP